MRLLLDFSWAVSADVPEGSPGAAVVENSGEANGGGGSEVCSNASLVRLLPAPWSHVSECAVTEAAASSARAVEGTDDRSIDSGGDPERGGVGAREGNPDPVGEAALLLLLEPRGRWYCNTSS